MDPSKLKRIGPRHPFDAEPPGFLGRRKPRLASEPTSRHLRLSDRWEPGFLRLPKDGVRGLSYVVDGLGIYFDATAPSELETLLQEGGWESAELLDRAEAGMAALRQERLSVDNDPRRRSLDDVLATGPAGDGRRPRVAIVDQPVDDPAIGFSLAGPSRFAAMLEAAAREHPEAERVVVMDPAAPVDGPRGHLARLGATHGARIVREPVEAWSVIESCESVYVVSSHLGFEAAVAGRPVTCFGVTFYSGWGFTDDRLIPPRRTRERSVAEVFAAAYLLYCRYFDPYEGKPCRFEEAVATLGLIARRNRENAAPTLCLGFASWKKPWLAQVLATAGHGPTISDATAVKPEQLRRTSRVVAWASRMPDGTDEACRAAGVPLLRMEDGFLRSIGLGVGLRPGASYVLDRTGIYYDATGPSDLERLLEAGIGDAALLERAARLRGEIVAARLSKYNVGGARLPDAPPGRPIVLVAGQVEDDASIRLGQPTASGNAGLLRRVRERHPNAVIAYKPHPDVEAGLRPGQVPEADLAASADMVLRDVSAPDAIDAADRVEVATSLIGFEALLRGKPVTTHGLPFYAGWGLTESPACPRRTRRLSLDELVAAALILYPRYLDPQTGLPCEPETLVRRLAARDPDLTRRERTAEAYLKQAWSAAWRRFGAR